MIVRSKKNWRIGDGDKLRSAFNVGAITELIFFKVRVTRFMARVSRRNKISLIGESYLA